jgi:4-carboxymuconolactone decarboxylase
MRTLVLTAALYAIAAGAAAQTRPLPADINSESYSRLPLVKRDQMDENGKRVYVLIVGKDRTSPLLGPAGVSLYSPGAAVPIRELNEYLRQKGVLGSRLTEIAILVAAREIDQQYEWSGHEPGALRVGVEQSIIDVVKYDKEVAGLGEKESVIIRFGRQLFREKKLSSALLADAERLFGKQGTVELATLMGDYAMAGILLHAVDQHLPPDRKELLPVTEPRP